MTRSKVIVFAPDLHYPKHDVATWKALLDFIGRNKVDGFIFGGDQMDNEEISRFTIGKGLYKPTGSFKRNEEQFDVHILTPLEKLLKGAKKYWIVGNHDLREASLNESQPELKGCFDRTVNLRLKQRGWKIIENGKCLRVGKLAVIHGDQLTSAGGFPARRALDTYMRSVLCGHFHYAQSFSKVCPVEQSQKYMGWASPCLCRTNPEYMKNRPSNWVNGFTVIEVQPGGNFNLYPVIVSNGKFSFGGKVYGNK
jgi:hypothetical protein